MEVTVQFADYQDNLLSSVVVCTALAVVAFELVKKRKYGNSGRSVISLFASSLLMTIDECNTRLKIWN